MRCFHLVIASIFSRPDDQTGVESFVGNFELISGQRSCWCGHEKVLPCYMFIPTLHLFADQPKPTNGLPAVCLLFSAACISAADEVNNLHAIAFTEDRL